MNLQGCIISTQIRIILNIKHVLIFKDINRCAFIRDVSLLETVSYIISTVLTLIIQYSYHLLPFNTLRLTTGNSYFARCVLLLETVIFILWMRSRSVRRNCICDLGL